MSPISATLVPFLVSMLSVAVIHPALVRFARAKNIVDNPNTRKLQLAPVPVLGGIGVFFGITMGLVCACVLADCSSLFVLFGCMLLMMYVGAMDDVLDISPLLRLASQILAVLALIYAGGLSLDNFHGLWGVGHLPTAVSLPLTVVAVVGIINSMNLIDGVDGLFAIFTISVCAIFALVFFMAGDVPFYVLAVASIGALIPFLLHNAFGKRSKMFVGDGGTLLMGVAVSAFVMRLDSHPVYGEMFASRGMGIVPFVLALLAVPVFDTLRVMIARIIRGGSPLVGDKTHLHHMFIWLGVSHVGTAVSVVSLNLLVVLAWWVSVLCGASVDVQFYVVVASALAVTCGVYYSVRLICRLWPDEVNRFRAWKERHKPSRRAFEFMRRLMDSI